MGSPIEKYKFTGKERDKETEINGYDGLDYFGARYYDAVIGRWLAVDPQAGRYPEISPYNYTLNNPINNTDPNGEWVWGAVIGAAVDYGLQVAGNVVANGGNVNMNAFTDVDVGSILISGAAGLASGGLSSLTKLKSAKALISATVNVAERAAKSDGNYSVSEGLIDAVVGVGSSAVGVAVDNTLSKGMKKVSTTGKAADQAKAKGVNSNPKASAQRKARYNNASKKAESEFNSSVDDFWKSNAAQNAGVSNAASAGTGTVVNSATDDDKKK